MAIKIRLYKVLGIGLSYKKCLKMAYLNTPLVWMTLEQHGFEQRRSIYMQTFSINAL